MTKFEKETLCTLLKMYQKELETHITEGAPDTQFDELSGQRIENIRVYDILTKVRAVEKYAFSPY